MSHSGSGHSSRQYLGTGPSPATNSAGGVAGGAGNSAPGDSLGINNQPQVLTGAGPNIVAGGTTSAVDIPPDMAVLLSKLDQDFMVDKTIDQWTYINRREEIMQSITRLHQRQQQQQSDDWAVLDPDQLETPLNPRRSFDIQQDSPSDLVNILESRAKIYKSETAFMVLDIRGKEVSSITWEKLYLKAVKVCYEILHKLSLTNNDTVVLLYKDGEVAEFVVALFGCFMAGVTAIPIHQDISLMEVLEIIKLTSTKLLLYSETVAKELDRLNTQAQPINWPSKLMRWRTTEFGSAKKSELSHWQMKQSQRKRSNSQTQTQNNQNLAYVEFSRSPLGELRGIALSHRTISHQMNCLNVALSSLPNSDNLQRSYTQYQRNCKVVLATLDIRFSIGIIMGILFTVYSGNVHIWAPQRVMEVQGSYANIISKCKASLLLADYIGLKRVTYDYQQSPNATRYFSKTQRVDFSSVKWVLVNALTIDGEFVEILSQRYLRPLGCQRPDNAVIPMLTLSDYGGMVISLRDWIGSQEKLGVPLGDDDDSSDLSSVLIDKETLSRNIVKIVETNPSAFDDISHDLLRVDAFGYPIPDATLAVVNPESSILVSKGELGEIWIDSPCLSGGFYGLRKESKSIFRARCRGAYGYLEMEFLRTGLLGFTYNGKVYVLGLYEDRIRQRVSWIDQKLYKKLNRDLIIGNNGSRYHYSSHLLATLAREVKQVYDCTIFDIFIGNEYLPVAIVEAEVIRKTVEDSNQDSNEAADDYVSSSAVPLNEPVLNAIAQKCFDTLYRRHFLRLYCVLVVDCDTLPKIMRSGGREIANMLCKKRFLEGSLRAEFVKFFVRKSISMIPHGEDIIGGIWSPYVSELRSMALANFPNQYSNVDYRDSSLDDKTGAPLTDFKTIIDILKFRVARSGDSIAFHNLDNGSGSSKSKPLTWKKLEHRAYSACHYLIEKASIKPGQYVILMYSLSEEFVVAVYACLICGIIPIPMLPFDSNRIGEDFPAFVGVIKDFDVSEILVNDEVEKFLKNGPVADSLKKISHKKVKALRIKNTVKLTKLSNIASLNSKIATYQAAVNFRDSHTTAMVWLNFTSDHYRVGTVLSHSNIIGMCKVFKETCNLNSQTPIVGCVRHASGIGFIQVCLLGVFLGTTTYLVSPVSYAENPLQFFLTLARYKVKDAFVTEQMLKYAAIKFSPKGFNLSNLKNMMISTENRRVEIDFLRKISKVFSPTKLSAAAMSTVYNHYFNPMISTRSYMTVAPVDLYLDPLALRQGYVSVVNQADFPNALHIQDSGMVPVCTEIAIVNPETRRVCKEGEFGEIWVKSDANLNSFTNGPKGPVDGLSQAQFNAQIVGGDPQSKYARTGDLGFLHHISITKNDGGENAQEGGEAGGGRRSSNITSFQPLFVLGKIADTFEVMGLHHFPIDIENTIESCHSDIYNNGSCVFKCSDYTIVVCESKRTRYYSSLVPLIVNTVFSKHHIIIDIVAFIKKGEFPISRLGTKQRARIVDAWVQGVIPISASYGVNYGENSMIKLIKDIDVVAREDPVMGLKNPALSYYDTDMDDDVFADNRQPLTLNQAQPSGNPVFNNSGAFESNSTSELIM